MKPYLQIKLATGHVFELPASVIAEDMAQHLHKNKASEFATIEYARKDVAELFASDSEVREWLLNNMDLDATMGQARMIEFTPPEIDWNEAEITHHDASASVKPLQPTAIMAAPVEMVVSQMAAEKLLCNALTMNGQDDGHPQQALVFIAGGPLVVNVFMQALSQISEHVSALINEQNGVMPAVQVFTATPDAGAIAAAVPANAIPV